MKVYVVEQTDYDLGTEPDKAFAAVFARRQDAEAMAAAYEKQDWIFAIREMGLLRALRRLTRSSARLG